MCVFVWKLPFSLHGRILRIVLMVSCAFCPTIVRGGGLLLLDATGICMAGRLPDAGLMTLLSSFMVGGVFGSVNR